MIEIKFIDSPDMDILGKREIFRNYFTIGAQNTDILVRDPKIKTDKYFFKINADSKLSIAPLDDTLFSLVNKKRYNKEKNLRPGDQVQIGNTIFIINNFLFAKEFNPETEILEKLEKLYDADHAITNLLSNLREIQNESE